MPLARLTMDRFGSDFSGGTSAASILAANLQLAFPTDPGIAALTTGTPPTVIPPGTPNIVAASQRAEQSPAISTPRRLIRFRASQGIIYVDASKEFVHRQLQLVSAGSRKRQHLRTLQPTGAATPTPSFDTSTSGRLSVLQLTADNGLGVVKTAAFHFAVADLVPTYVGAPPLTTPPTSPCPAGLGVVPTFRTASCLTRSMCRAASIDLGRRDDAAVQLDDYGSAVEPVDSDGDSDSSARRRADDQLRLHVARDQRCPDSLSVVRSGRGVRDGSDDG